MTEAPKERDLIIELFHIIRRQPELHQEWEDMPNAERNVMAGAFYNAIEKYSSAKESRDKVLDIPLQRFKQNIGGNIGLDNGDIPMWLSESGYTQQIERYISDYIVAGKSVRIIIQELRTKERSCKNIECNTPGCLGLDKKNPCENYKER